jgi:hypothetical protein
MKHLLTLGLTLAFAAPIAAAPYCPQLLDEAQLESRYKRLAPIFSDQQTGWIFTSDQMNVDYTMTSEEEMLMAQIAQQIAAHDTKLAIMVAPPRPIIAGQAIVDETLGGAGEFDVAAAQASFAALIEQLRATGAIVPNLMDVALAHEGNAPYYFQRDTHWTSTGAAVSAIAMAEEAGISVSYAAADIAQLDIFEERGSLSNIVEATCGSRDAVEAMDVLDYSSVQADTGLGLLDDTDAQASVTLLGTSFSNRYQRDEYQVADALAASFGTSIENLSVSGGGMIGPIEEFALSGGLQTGTQDMIIWEFPYTEGVTTSALRQLLGALQANAGTTIADHALTVVDNEVQVELASSEQGADVLHVVLDTVEAQQIYVDLTFPDGKVKTIKMRRKESMQQFGQHADWFAHIGDYSYGDAVSVSLRIDAKANATTANLTFMAAL